MDRRAILVAVLLAAVVGVPFLGKAYHIDDTFVLKVADQVLREPLRPYHADINWGRGANPIAERTKNPPLLSYYLAPFLRLCGRSEVVLHAAMLVFLVMLAAGAGLLGRWFWVDEWWPMAFVMLSPAVVVSSNVMRDVPAAGLLTLGLALFVLGTDEDRRGLTLAGALLVGLATLTKYSAAAMVPLLVLYPLLRRKWRRALYALVPVALLGLWCLHNWWSQGTPHILRLLQQRAAATQGFHRPWEEKLIAGLVITGSMLFLLPALVVAWLRRWACLALPLVIAVGAGAWFGVNAYFGGAPVAERPDLLVRANGTAVAGRRVKGGGDYVYLRIRDRRTIRVPRGQVAEVSPQRDHVVRGDGHKFVGRVVSDTPEAVVVEMHGSRRIRVPTARVARVEKLTWQYYLWATTGAALLAVALVGGLLGGLRAKRHNEEAWAEWLFLAAWAGGGIAFSVLFTPFQATRHFLPVLAPLVVLVLGLLGPRRRHVKVVLGIVLALQLVVAYVVGFADTEYAGAHRRFAEGAARTFASEDVWFNGHWGWQTYAQDRHGFTHAWAFRDTGQLPPAGAILLEPGSVHRSRLPDGFRQRLVELEPARRVYHARFPARTMDGIYASFYASTDHRLPYHLTFATTPIETCRAYRVGEQPSGEGAGQR